MTLKRKQTPHESFQRQRVPHILKSTQSKGTTKNSFDSIARSNDLRTAIFGSNHKSETLIGSLSKIKNLGISAHSSNLNLGKKLSGETLCAIFLVEPLLGLNRSIAYLKSKGNTAKTPIYIIAGNEISRAKTLEFYQKGVHGVFTMPRDQDVFPELFKILTLSWLTEETPREASAMIERFLKARLRQTSCHDKDTTLKLESGEALFSLEGSAPQEVNQAKLALLVDPTVNQAKGFFDHPSIKCASTNQANMERHLYQELASDDSIPHETVACSVVDHSVHLVGNAPSQKVRERIVTRMKRLVEPIHLVNSLRVSPKKFKEDTCKSRELKDSIDQVVVAPKVEVSVADNLIILRGKVSNYSAKNVLQEFLSSKVKGAKVLNRLSVSEI